jgi:hypothetical protein
MAARIVPEGGWGSRLKPERTPRVHVRRHLVFVKSLPCICCLVEGREIQADDPMHIRTASLLHGTEGGAGAMTSDDRWTLPGCRPHHNDQHDEGAELAFWTGYGIDPHLLALVLWGLTGNYHGAVLALRLHAGRAAGNRGIDEWRNQTALTD